VSVVRRDARRRWSLVAGGVAMLCALPALLGALPAPRSSVDPATLRERIQASARQPYQGFVATEGRIGLPDLPDLGTVGALLGGGTRVRAWYAGPRSWRVATLDQTGERDVYQTADGVYLWDFERNVLTHLTGVLRARLPWAADLTPPELARRLLDRASPDDRISVLPARRIAGRAAAGVRTVPTDPASTVGRLDIWADPDTGLPLEVEIAGRGQADPLFSTRFLDVDLAAPSAALLTPSRPDGIGFVRTELDAGLALDRVAPALLRSRLAGRDRLGGPGGVSGVGAYGAGWSTFVVVRLPGRAGGRTLRAIEEAGGAAAAVPGAEAYELGNSLLNTLVVRSPGSRQTRRTYLLAGLVTPVLLRQAATELLLPAP
jgi:hypothetical protein